MGNCAYLIKQEINCKDIEVFCFASLDSTNNEAKRWIENGFTGGALIVAEKQTSGRGRQGKSFYSDCTGGIYMTALFAPDGMHRDPAGVTIAAAVATAKAIEDATGLSPRIKWVNDLFYNGKKIAGILAETKDKFVIVGIGINCDADEKAFPQELKGIAGGIPVSGTSKEKLIASIYNYLCHYMDADFAETIDEYRERSFMVGRTVQYLRNDSYITATVQEIDDYGSLIVQNEDGSTERLSSGEVVIIDNLYARS